MKHNGQQQNIITSKISSINNSINTMMSCVKTLEKFRSYNYLTSLKEKDLNIVLNRMQELEDSIDKISKQPGEGNNTSSFIKAIGKNRKLLLKKPKTEDKQDNKETTNTNNENNKKRPSANPLKTKASMDKVFEKNITSKNYHEEAKQRVKKLVFKPVNRSF